MFSNIGGKIKGLAVVICILGIAASVLGGIALISANSRYNPTATAGWIVLIAGSLGSWIGSFTLYGFGELIEKTCENNEALLWMKAEMQKGNNSAPAEKNDARKNSTIISTNSASSTAKDAIQIAVPEYVLNNIQDIPNACEICNYLSGSITDTKNAQILLQIIKRIADTEKNHQINSKSEAINIIDSFIKHGNKVFPVDRSGSMLRCPVCGLEQPSHRYNCTSCKALFKLD